MQESKRLLMAGLVLATLACNLSGRQPTAMPRTATPPVLGTSLPPTPTLRPTVPIDLHVGYAINGPWFELYFTDPADPAGSQFTGGVDEHLVSAIDSARLSVHAAIYNLSLNNVRQALIRAHRRGVTVRLVTESDNLDGYDFGQLIGAGIPVLGDRRESSMHDKFMIIDGQEVWSGSLNYTNNGVYEDNNGVMRIFSEDLARAYEAEFMEMFVEDIFGAQGGTAGPFPAMQISGTPVEILFAPDDRPEDNLVSLLDSAQHSVEFLAYSFTSDSLGQALLRAHEAGIRVRGVMDEVQTRSNIGTEWTSFKAAGLDVRLDGNAGQMHQKVLIIDGEVVALGSYNFSRNANESNDENVLIVHSPVVAHWFMEEFGRIYALALP